MNGQFSEEDLHMANKCTENCSPLLAIKEIQIKITLRLSLDTEWQSSRKQSTINAGRIQGKRTLVCCW
jgi:hypothetical protein